MMPKNNNMDFYSRMKVKQACILKEEFNAAQKNLNHFFKIKKNISQQIIWTKKFQPIQIFMIDLNH